MPSPLYLIGFCLPHFAAESITVVTSLVISWTHLQPVLVLAVVFGIL